MLNVYDIIIKFFRFKYVYEFFEWEEDDNI